MLHILASVSVGNQSSGARPRISLPGICPDQRNPSGANSVFIVALSARVII